MEYIVSICAITLDVLSLLNLSAVFLCYRKFKNKLILPSIIIGYIAFEYLLIRTINILNGTNLIKLLMVMLCNVIFVNGLFTGKTSGKFFSLSVFYVFSAIADYFSAVLVSLPLKIALPLSYVSLDGIYILLIIPKFVLFVVSFFIWRIWHKKHNFVHVSMLEWLQMLMFPVTSFVLLIAIAYFNTMSGIQSYLYSYLSIGILASNIFILFIMARLSDDKQIRHDNEMLSQQLKMNMETVDTLTTSYDSQRKMNHDFNNHLETIRSLIAVKDYGVAADYIDNIRNSAVPVLMVKSNNSAIDAILNYKYSQATAQDIVMDFNINDLSAIQLSKEDVVSMLGNVLDNAIEAAAKCGKNKRISVKINKGEEETVISVRNTISKPVEIIDNHIKSTKENLLEHGYGLKNIESILNKYGASFVLSADDEWFSFCTIIPNE
ncbi:MAG: sensor histidine kinase [Erysipelotrichaceae bacterium]